jgi:hypothetical protein
MTAGQTAGNCVAIEIGLAVNDVAVGGDSVYYSEYQTIFRAPKMGGPSTVFLGGFITVYKLAADAQRLFFTNYIEDNGSAVTVQSVPLAGGTPQVLGFGNNPASVVVDSQYVYYGDVTGNDGSWSLHRAPLAGGPTVDVAIGKVILSIGLGPDHVYWTDTEFPDVHRVPYAAIPDNASVPDGAPTPHADSNKFETFAPVDHPGYLAVRDGFVYWGEPRALTLWRTAIDSGETVALAAGVPVEQILVDSTSIYFIALSSVGDLLLRMPRAGGTIELLTEVPPGTVVGVAMDDDAIYLGCGGNSLPSDGAVFRIAK